MMSRSTCFLFLSVTLTFLLSASPSMASDDWLQWGGPNGDFTVDVEGLADSWPKGGPRRIWEREFGDGYSGVVVKGDRLYTMMRDGDDEVIVALDVPTGKTVWEHRYPAKFWEDMVMRFGPGPNATPAIAGDRLITVGINAELRCVSLDEGKLLWRHDLVEEYGRVTKQEEYGYSNSPLLYKDTVIVFINGKNHGVIAFDPDDGSEVWKSEPSGIAYAQATPVTIDGQDQLVFFSFTEVIGMDPATGRFLWSHPCVPGNGNNLTPVFLCGERHLWVASQFDQGGGRVLELKKNGEKFDVKQLWFSSRMRGTHWTSIPIGDYIYGSIGGNNSSLLCCVNWKTGEREWRRRGFHKCLCLFADGKLIFLDEHGTLAMARVGPETVEVLSSTQVTESWSWTVPTLVGKTLYVRDRKRIMALDLGATAD